MKITGLIAATLAVLMLAWAPAPALAREKGHMPGHRMKMMKEHHRMNRDMMIMLKETMTILKGLEHKPSPAQKKKLGEMIERLEKDIEHHRKMMKKYKDRDKHKDGRNGHEGSDEDDGRGEHDRGRERD